MGPILVFMLNTLSGCFKFGDQPSGGSVKDLEKGLPEYHGTMWETVSAVHNLGVKPVTSMILAIMFTMMLARTSASVDGDSQLGAKIVAVTMFKVAMVFLVVQNAMPILGALNQISTDITKVITQNPGAGVTCAGDMMKNRVDAMNPMEQVGALLLMFIPFILGAIVFVVPFVLIFSRFFQLYIMSAFASLPLAFLGHEDTKPISIGFLKAFAATALSGTVIVLVMKLYASVNFAGLENFNGDVLPFITGNFWNMLIAPLLLLFGLVTANGLAKKLVGDG